MSGRIARKQQPRRRFIHVFLPFAAYSANALYTQARRGITLHKRYRAWRARVKAALCVNGAFPRIHGPVSITVMFGFADRRKRDLDNGLKALIDALKRRLIDDDDEVYRIIATKRYADAAFIDICIRATRVPRAVRCLQCAPSVAEHVGVRCPSSVAPAEPEPAPLTSR